MEKLSFLNELVMSTIVDVDGKKHLRLASPNVGFTWYIHDEDGWRGLNKAQGEVLESAMQKEWLASDGVHVYEYQ